MNRNDASTSRNTRKIAAIAAGALVLGLGATYTLATWSDSEWIWGGANGEAGIGSSTFEVEQSVNGGTDWTNDLASPGGSLVFAPNALQLTPGDTTYAPVSLRTQAGSMAGDVTLKAAVPNSAITGTSTALWSAVRVSVYTSDAATAPACSAAAIGSWTAVSGLSNVELGTNATGTQRVNKGATSADPGAAQHYCFAITLPTGSPDTLQGTKIAPVWQFDSVSVVTP